MEFIDTAVDRKRQQSEIDVDRLTLAVNTGTLITYDRDALRRWQSRHPRTPNPQEFRATVSRLASMFPGKVQKPN